MEGFATSPAGGPELGGVLYGTRTGNRVRVSANRPVACEHAHGPAFTLSKNDEAGLEKLLRQTAEEDEELIPVGWYHTAYHELRPATGTVTLQNRWFPEPWQMVMVLQREKGKPVRVGVFPRDSYGELAAYAEHQRTVNTLGDQATALGWPSSGVASEANGAAQNRDGLACLLDGIRERSGVMLVACPAGGEMRLLADLRYALKEKSVALALVKDAPATRDQFYRRFSEALHLRRLGSSAEGRVGALLGFLWAQARTGAATLLVLNQAENLSGEVVEEIRALDELRGSGGRLLQTILCCTRAEGVENLQERLTDSRAAEGGVELGTRWASVRSIRSWALGRLG
jgi:hypothetical protein